MNTRSIQLPRARHPARAVCLVACLLLHGPWPAAAVTPPRITSASLAGGKVSLTWTGNSLSYEVQRTASLVAPNWTSVLATFRTNVLIPVNGDASFFRVVDPKTNANTLVLNATNLATGASVTLTMQPRTNADLRFNAPTNDTAFDQVLVVFPSAELRKFDVSFNDAGGFAMVTNGAPTAYGGWWTKTPGPGQNDITYSGFMTNGADLITFSGVTDPSPDGDAVSGLIGAMQWLYCAPGFAAQQLSCAAACAAQALACAFQFPPKLSYCTFVTQIIWSPNAQAPTCLATCEHGCK
jgi:hypothetical protein